MFLRHQRLPKLAPLVVCFLVVFVLFLVGGLPALSLTGRVLFVLFIPGFSILQALVSGEFDFLERLVLSPAVGITYASLVALYLSVLNVPMTEFTVILSVLLLSVPLLAYSWKRGGLGKASFKSSVKPSTYFFLVLLLVGSIVLISVPFPENGILMPRGDDPTTSALAATMIAEQGGIPESWAPYFAEQSSFTYSPANPSVMAFLYLLDPSMSMSVLVSLFSVFFAVIHGEIFVLTRRLFRDDGIALSAAAFSALLSVGFYQMIIDGRFPGLVGLALTLNLLLFSYLYVVTGKRRFLLLAGITLASVSVAYTVSFITAALFVVLFFSFGLIFFKNKKQSVWGGATVLAAGIGLSLPWVSNILSRLTIEIPEREYGALLVWFDVYSVRGEFGSGNLFLYYGYWLFLFLVVGVLVFLVRRRVGSFLLAWFLSVFLLMLNEMLRIRFPGWYYLQSGAFLNPTLSFPLSVLAGAGFVGACGFLKRRFQCFSRKVVKTSLHLVLVAALLLFTFLLGTAMLVPPAGIRANRISTADYDAMVWIAGNTPREAVIFNDHWVGTPSTWIPVVCHRRIVMPLLSISEVGWSNVMFTRQDESVVVARDPNSSAALSILRKYDVSYIYLSNNVSAQVQEWRNNYDARLFLQSPHYELAFKEDDAWVIRVIY